MFIYDKDMERVMLAKKKEVLSEIEAAKARVLKELYCVKRGVHTDMCEMLADYNRIDFMLKKTVKDCKKQIEDTVKEFQVIIANTFNEYNTEIDLRISHLENLEAQVTAELNAKVAEFEAMEGRVSDAIAQLENLIAEGVVSQDDFDVFKEEVNGLLATAGAVSDWAENDPESKAYVKNRTHYGEVSESVEWEKAYNVYIAKTKTITLSNVNESSWPNLTATYYNLDIEVPESCNVVNLIHSRPNEEDVVFTLNRLDGSFIFHDDGTSVGENCIVYGEPYNGEIVFDQAIWEDKYILAYNPAFGMWRLYSRLDLSQYLGYKIVCSSGTVTKELAPEYLAKNGAVGSVLANAGSHSEWVKLPGTSVNVMELTEIFNDHLDYNSSVTYTNEFTYSGSLTATELIELFGDKGSVNIIVYSCGDKTYTEKTPTRNPSSNEWTVGVLSANTYAKRIKASIYGTSQFTAEQMQSGIDVRVYKYKSYIKKELFAPADIAETPVDGAMLTVENGVLVWKPDIVMLSPNGTKYKLTVSNDGTLSATPVTQ